MLSLRAVTKLASSWLLFWGMVAGCGHADPPWGWDRYSDRWRVPPLAIVHLDVGQGDATLFVGPQGQSLLVDGGPASAGRSVVAALSELDIHTLDALVVTHPDADHIGGLARVLDSGVDVVAAWGEGSVADTQTYRQFTEALSGTEAGWLQVIDPGDRIELGDGAVATCTASGGRLIDGQVLDVADLNDRSVGLKVEFGGFDYHVGGDLGAAVERALGPAVGDLDVVHLHHHGSAGSTCADWLNDVQAEVAVISVGRNGYDHPSWEVVDRLTGGDPAVTVELPEVFQTGAGERQAGAVLGTFSIVTDGSQYELDGRMREVDEP